MSYSHHHHHGNVLVGRMMVAAGCILILVANALVFKAASTPPHPLPMLKLIIVASLVWMVAGAFGMCMRTLWTRYLVLTILYAGSLGFFLAGIITVATAAADSPLIGRLNSIFIATGLYLYVSLVLTHSKHVRRLTSRALE